MIKQSIKVIANQLFFALCTRYAQFLFVTVCFSCLYNKKTREYFFPQGPLMCRLANVLITRLFYYGNVT